MHFKNIFKSLKNRDMLKKIGVVAALLLVYRFLSQVPIPIGNPTTFKQAVENLIGKSDFGNFINLISGGGLATLSILLIGLQPFITASIISQLMTKIFPRLEELSQDGEAGRRKINQWTRVLSVPLALLWAVAYMFILYRSVIATNTSVVVEPRLIEWILSASAIVAGSVVLMWLGELITEQGIGNGISTIILVSIISRVPESMVQLGRALFNTEAGSLSLFGWLKLPVNPSTFWLLLGLGLAFLTVIYFLVKVNEAQRIISINYAKRVHGNSSYGGIKSIMPIKLITAGVLPVIFATAFLSLPTMIGQILLTMNPGNTFALRLMRIFTSPNANNFATLYPGGITPEWFFYPSLYFLLVVAFTYFYTSVILNPEELADNLQKQGGFIDGVRPGQTTANYLRRVVFRLNLFGSLALGIIALLPYIADYVWIIIFKQPIGLSIPGTSLLILVTVALENLRQLDSRALMVTYDNYK